MYTVNVDVGKDALSDTGVRPPPLRRGRAPGPLATSRDAAATLGVSADSERREFLVDTGEARLVHRGGITIQIHTDGDLYLISLVGELDMSNADALDAELQRAEESRAGRIVLDLSGLEFIDSSGLELLVIAKRRSDDAYRFRIRPGRDKVTRLFALTKIDEFLDLEE
jgi:anti-sigma B factor antagonist